MTRIAEVEIERDIFRILVNRMETLVIFTMVQSSSNSGKFLSMRSVWSFISQKESRSCCSSGSA